MKRLTIFCAALFAAVTSFAAVTYELNGGVTNADNWQSKGDMFTAFMVDGGLTDMKTLDEYIAMADPFTAICGKLTATQVQAAFAIDKWTWLKNYITETQNAQVADGATALTEDLTAAGWRYAIAAFFLSNKRAGWPVSASYLHLGLDAAYMPAWKAAYANPTEPKAPVKLNAPYKENATFAGWYSAEDLSGDEVVFVDSTTTGTLYAKWVDAIPNLAAVKMLEDEKETTVMGVVTFISGKNVYIQDYSAGMLLYVKEEPTFELGQVLIAKGQKVLYGGAPEVKNVEVLSVRAGEMLAPVALETLDKLVNDSTAKYFGQLVTVPGLKVVSYDEYNNPYVTDGVDTVQCYKMSLDPTNVPVGTKVTITAIAGWYNKFQFVGDIAGIEIAVVGKKDTYEYPERHEGKYKLTNSWVITNNMDNFAANKPAKDDHARGMAVKDGKMYFINRDTKSITVVDGATGNMLEPIVIKGDHIFEVENEDGTWGAACTLPYNDIKFDQAGNCLIGSCMGGLNQTFIIYLVDLETGEATEVVREKLGANPDFEVSFASGRFDAFGVAGNVKENGVIMAAENQGSWNVYRWLIEGGVAAPAEEISMLLDPATDKSLYLEAAGFGTAAQIFPQDETGSVFYVDGFNTLPMLFDENGMLLDDFINCPYGTKVGNAEGDTCQMNTGHNGLCEFQVGNEYFLVLTATNTAGNPTSSFALYKFADESRQFSGLEPLWYFPANGMGAATNGCRTAVPSVEVKGGTAYIYVYTNNNGYARYELEVEGVTPVENVKVENINVKKFVENGQIFVIKNGVKYNVLGAIAK